MQARLPSPFAIFAITVAGLFGILTAARGLADSDYYWHITAGRLVAERGVLSTDPFSYTWAGQPWVMHEWLGELVIYWLVTAAGVGVVTFLFGVISVSGVLVVAWALHRIGVAMLPLALASGLVVVLYTPYATVRPQAFSWLFLGILIAGLLTTRSEHRWRPWLAIPLFVVWANVHGLYVIGLGVLGVYVLFTLLGRTPMASRRWEVAGVLLAAFAVSSLTPAGPAGLLYPLRYVDAGDWGLRNIAEWQSPNFHDPVQLGLLVLIAALLLNAMRATPGWLAVMASCGVIGSLLATRNVPLAALLALPTLALGLGDRLPGREGPRAARVQRVRRLMELGAAAAVLVAAVIIVPRLPALAGDRIVLRAFPAAAADRLEEIDPDARVLAEYGWGGYVIHRLFDSGGRVFVDGRNDMFGEQILEDYSSIRAATPGWEELLASYGADAILMPPEAALVDAAVHAGWCEVHRDELAVLLVRTCR
jgi:hypothetical protein